MNEEQATVEGEEQVSTALTTQRQEKAPIRIGERGLAFESAAEVFRMASFGWHRPSSVAASVRPG